MRTHAAARRAPNRSGKIPRVHPTVTPAKPVRGGCACGGSCPSCAGLIQRQADSGGGTAPARSNEYRNCEPEERDRLAPQLEFAIAAVQWTLDTFKERAKKKTEAVEEVESLNQSIDVHFRTDDAKQIAKIEERLRKILKALKRGGKNITCLTPGQCLVFCEGESIPYACAGPRSAIRICPPHFEQGDIDAAMTLVHEAAHQVGLMFNVMPSDKLYAQLSTFQALNNAESFAQLVTDSVFDTADRWIWTPEYLWIAGIVTRTGFGTDPIFRSEGRPSELFDTYTIPAGERDVRGKFGLYVGFMMEKASLKRPSPFTMPRVSLVITLLKSDGPVEKFRGEDDKPKRKPHNIEPSFGEARMVEFDPGESGTVFIEAKMVDPDTGTVRRTTQLLNLLP